MKKYETKRVKIDFTDTSKKVGDKVIPINKNLIPTSDLEDKNYNWNNPIEIVKEKISKKCGYDIQIIWLKANNNDSNKSTMLLGRYFKLI